MCEFINLTCPITPSGVTEFDVGGLQWQIDSGGGTLSGGAGGTGTYQCPDVAATAQLGVLLTGGAMLGKEKKAPAKAVVPPDGHILKQATGTGIKHVMGFVTVGFQGTQWATCAKAVSFAQIEVREGTCQSTASGYWAVWNNIKHDPSASWFNLSALTAGTGYKWTDVIDTVYTGQITPVGTTAVGAFQWPIPMMYRQKTTAGDGASYATVNHTQSCDAAGKATIDKGGAGPFSKNLADATSGY